MEELFYVLRKPLLVRGNLALFAGVRDDGTAVALAVDVHYADDINDAILVNGECRVLAFSYQEVRA